MVWAKSSRLHRQVLAINKKTGHQGIPSARWARKRRNAIDHRRDLRTVRKGREIHPLFCSSPKTSRVTILCYRVPRAPCTEVSGRQDRPSLQAACRHEKGRNPENGSQWSEHVVTYKDSCLGRSHFLSEAGAVQSTLPHLRSYPCSLACNSEDF